MAVTSIRAASFLALAGILVALGPALLDGSYFAMHPMAMSIAYVGLMAEGILLASMVRHADSADRLACLLQHAFVQGASLVSAALGLAVIWRNKVALGKPHFATLHSKAGLLTLLMSAASVLLGASGFRRFGLAPRLSLKAQLRVKALHRQMGTVTWYLSLLTMQLAMPHPAVLSGLAARVWQALVVFLGFAMAVLLLRHGKGMLPARHYYGGAQKLL